MKTTNKPLKDILFRPFRFVAGWEALLPGIVLMVLLSYLGYTSKTYFDGALDIHLGSLNHTLPYLLHLWYQLSSWICLTAILYITAKLASKSSIRLLDMAGTLALSRIPLILITLFAFIPNVHIAIEPNADLQSMIQLLSENIIWLILTSIVSIVVMVWWIALMYNAYSISSNLKGTKAGVSFAIGLIVAEILSKILNALITPLI